MAMEWECRKCGGMHPMSFVTCPRYARGRFQLALGVFIIVIGLFYASKAVMAVLWPDEDGDILAHLLEWFGFFAAGFFIVFGGLLVREHKIVREHPEMGSGPLDHMRFCPSCGRGFVPPAASCVDCGHSLKGIA